MNKLFAATVIFEISKTTSRYDVQFIQLNIIIFRCRYREKHVNRFHYLELLAYLMQLYTHFASHIIAFEMYTILTYI